MQLNILRVGICSETRWEENTHLSKLPAATSLCSEGRKIFLHTRAIWQHNQTAYCIHATWTYVTFYHRYRRRYGKIDSLKRKYTDDKRGRMAKVGRWGCVFEENHLSYSHKQIKGWINRYLEYIVAKSRNNPKCKKRPFFLSQWSWVMLLRAFQ